MFDAEAALLQGGGIEVHLHEANNADLNEMGGAQRLRTTVYNASERDRLGQKIAEVRPNVVHFHNTFPLMSPAVFDATVAAGVPSVQTLHNFRLTCPNAFFLRDGRPCEDCLGKAIPWPGVRHACYRGSHAASAAVAAMLGFHRLRGTWRKVDAFIALTEFSRSKMIEAGFDAARIHVKPNFLSPDPGRGTGDGGFALFVGRLSEEKGIVTLLKAWQEHHPGLPLKIAGTGPLEDLVREANGNGVEYLGALPKAEILVLMSQASLLVVPSIWYEGMPMVLVEAMAVGLPVVASDLGNLISLVDERSGRRFSPGESEALARTVKELQADSALLKRLSDGARGRFEEEFSAEKNLQRLLDIYNAAGAK